MWFTYVVLLYTLQATLQLHMSMGNGAYGTFQIYKCVSYQAISMYGMVTSQLPYIVLILTVMYIWKTNMLVSYTNIHSTKQTHYLQLNCPTSSILPPVSKDT